jgi:hypothetical protein|tara:strand:+ start:150 stop:323 length:174 start_codon:yes stop_codon:yes gene_type:complete
MGLMGGGLLSPVGTGKDITLNDKAGVDTYIVRDSDGFPIFKVFSNGNYGFKGKVVRI